MARPEVFWKVVEETPKKIDGSDDTPIKVRKPTPLTKL